MLFSLDARDYGRHNVRLPERFAGPVVLELALPAGVKFLGVNLQDVGGVDASSRQESFEREGLHYNRISIALDNEIITRRVLEREGYYRITVWFESPAVLDGTVSYDLYHGDDILASGSSRLVTAGRLDPGKELPRRFGFYPYGGARYFPNDDYDRISDFYRRFGISGLSTAWHDALPGNEYRNNALLANRRHGIKNIANLSFFARKWGGLNCPMMRRDTEPAEAMRRGGLVRLVDETCEGLESEDARSEWESIHEFFDMVFWDWEPIGPQRWPGYEDTLTIGAFAEARGISGELTTETVEDQYREEYARFRMEQITRTLYSLKKTVDSVKPMPFRVEQGEGVRPGIDYELYADDFDALSPMIYRPSPLRYAQALTDMLSQTSVPAEKFWPTVTLGWKQNTVFRESPEEYLLDTIVTAASGCGSLSHWPNIQRADASWFGIHEGLVRIALVEDFYLDGTVSDDSLIRGIPYRETEIVLGSRRIVQSAPDWNASLLTFVHELDGEYLLTILNYHREEDAFVRLSLPSEATRYLVNPVEGVYTEADERMTALVRVPKESPAMWIATSKPGRISGLPAVDAARMHADFLSARRKFLDGSRKEEIQIGTVGDISVNYVLTEFGGAERVSLEVAAGTQMVYFGESGGRIYDWRVEGMDDFVAKGNHATAGMCKDMLWIPVGARWSGDEARDYVLVECSNDGSEARIVYESDFVRGFPGLGIRKVYRVSAEENSIIVEVEFRNDLVDEIMFSYWSHSLLTMPESHFVTGSLLDRTPPGGTTVFKAAGLEDEFKHLVILPDHVVGHTGPVFAEFFPEGRAGLIFRLPDNFMNVHRWSSLTKRSTEWMSRPIVMPPGTSSTLRFSVTAVPDATPELLRSEFRRIMGTDLDSGSRRSASGNLLPEAFDNLDDDGIPAGWRVVKRGNNPESARVTAERDETGGFFMKAAMPDDASVYLESAERLILDPDQDYLFAVQVKIDDMHYVTDSWWRDGAGLRINIAGDGITNWMAIHGEGSTDGWVACFMPFPRDGRTAQERRGYARTRISLRCYNMTGTVSFRDPVLMIRPEGMDGERYFEFEDGRRTLNSHIELFR